MESQDLIPHTPLEAPLRVTEQSWPENVKPVVSVRCMTYQHVNFIRDAIEGFLMQETTFPIEILIHDDASTDGTAEIVREYAARYPNLIRAVLQTENQYSKGNKPGKILGEMCRGEFIAVCEGDDYWVNRRKLLLQVAMLYCNPDFSMCAGKTDAVLHMPDGSHEFKRTYEPEEKKSSYAFSDLIGNYCMHTSSFCYRNGIVERPAWASGVINGDVVTIALMAHVGNVGFVDENLSVYRIHKGGMWSGENNLRTKCLANLITYNRINSHFNGAYSTTIMRAHSRNLEYYFQSLACEGRLLEASKLAIKSTEYFKGMPPLVLIGTYCKFPMIIIRKVMSNITMQLAIRTRIKYLIKRSL